MTLSKKSAHSNSSTASSTTQSIFIGEKMAGKGRSAEAVNIMRQIEQTQRCFELRGLVESGLKAELSDTRAMHAELSDEVDGLLNDLVEVHEANRTLRALLQEVVKRRSALEVENAGLRRETRLLSRYWKCRKESLCSISGRNEKVLTNLLAVEHNV